MVVLHEKPMVPCVAAMEIPRGCAPFLAAGCHSCFAMGPFDSDTPTLHLFFSLAGRRKRRAGFPADSLSTGNPGERLGQTIRASAC